MAGVADVVERYLSAYRDRSWIVVQRLLDEQITMRTYATELVEVKGRDAVMSALRDASRTPYDVSVTRWEDLDERTALAVGRVRHATDGGGFSEHDVAWLWVVDGGRILSGIVYDGEEQARRAFLER